MQQQQVTKVKGNICQMKIELLTQCFSPSKESLFSVVQGLMISTSAAESFSLYENVSKSKMYAELETRLMRTENVVGCGNNF